MTRPMERLWAGWRSAYIAAAGPAESAGEKLDDLAGRRSESDSGAPAGESGEGSIFARILASGLPDEETHVVWRGQHCFVILNAYPYTTGHVLVMPVREVANLEDLEPEEATELWAAVTDAVRSLKAAYKPHGINVGVNLGEAAGAGVPNHVHVHVLPRWNADSNFMTSVAETRVLPEPLDETWRKLRAAWPAR